MLKIKKQNNTHLYLCANQKNNEKRSESSICAKSDRCITYWWSAHRLVQLFICKEKFIVVCFLFTSLNLSRSKNNLLFGIFGGNQTNMMEKLTEEREKITETVTRLSDEAGRIVLDRFKNPYILTFLISWIFFNWRPISFFILSSEKVETKIKFINK